MLTSLESHVVDVEVDESVGSTSFVLVIVFRTLVLYGGGYSSVYIHASLLFMCSRAHTCMLLLLVVMLWRKI